MLLQLHMFMNILSCNLYGIYYYCIMQRIFIKLQKEL